VTVSANAIVWWVTLIALVVVLALAGAQVARALRELNRIKGRIAAYAELPLFKALERAEADSQRLERALASVAPLLERAQAALEVIRRGPVPPELVPAAKGVVAELVALRRFASR
jgi:hypothetical protein